MKRLMIADDHQIVLSGLASLLESRSYEVVGRARDGAEALELLPKARPDVIIVDLSMPKHSGLEVLRILRARGSKIPLIILTADIDDDRLLEALRLHVNGVVLKESASTRLFECLDQIALGERLIEPALLQRMVDLALTGKASGSSLGDLNARERAIADLVSQGRSNRDIGDKLGITEGTVKVALHRMYDKLGIKSRTELLLRVRDQA